MDKLLVIHTYYIPYTRKCSKFYIYSNVQKNIFTKPRSNYYRGRLLLNHKSYWAQNIRKLSYQNLLLMINSLEYCIKHHTDRTKIWGKCNTAAEFQLQVYIPYTPKYMSFLFSYYTEPDLGMYDVIHTSPSLP